MTASRSKGIDLLKAPISLQKVEFCEAKFAECRKEKILFRAVNYQSAPRSSRAETHEVDVRPVNALRIRDACTGDSSGAQPVPVRTTHRNVPSRRERRR
jgi:hypothetical protein